MTPELPHLRLWLGVTGEAPGDCRPDDDAGLFFEAIPTQGLHLRISVAGLAAKAEDLRRRGTPFGEPPGERPRLRVDVDGALLEFVDAA